MRRTYAHSAERRAESVCRVRVRWHISPMHPVEPIIHQSRLSLLTLVPVIFVFVFILVILNSNTRPLPVHTLDIRSRARKFVRIEREERVELCVHRVADDDGVDDSFHVRVWVRG